MAASIVRIALATFAVTAVASSAVAQFPPPPGVVQRGVGQTPRPAVSPYLNLLRPGASPAVNYYGIVRPTQNLQSSVSGLQTQTSSLLNAQSAATGVGDPAEVATGAPFGFQNHYFYFQNQYRRNGGGGGGGLGGGAGRLGAGVAGVGSLGRGSGNSGFGGNVGAGIGTARPRTR